MRILYHFRMSTYSRRARLALAHKGLEIELREAREHPEFREEASRKTPFVTFPVLVEEDGTALADSGAISRYLDRAYPDRPRIWPQESEDAFLVFETATLVDHALDALVATGTRFFKLRGDPAWPEVREAELDRIQRALDALARRVAELGRPTIARSGWSGADIWLYAATAWLAGLPARAAQPVPSQLLSLGWRLPNELVRWAEQHAGRPDVRALDRSPDNS